MSNQNLIDHLMGRMANGQLDAECADLLERFIFAMDEIDELTSDLRRANEHAPAA